MRDKEIETNSLGNTQGVFFEEPADENSAYLPSGKPNVPMLMKNAKILLAAGDTKLAKNIFRRLVETGESLGWAYAGLGSCYELEGKTDLALKAYREAIIFEPTFGTLFALAEVYIGKGDYQSAVGTLLRASNLGKLNSRQQFDLHKSLGSCYLELGQLGNSESHYRRAYEIDPANDVLHVNIGSLAIKKGDFSTALLHFKESIRISPKNANAFAGAGLAQAGLGQVEQAHQFFCDALNVDICHVTALYHMVKTSYELKRFSTASELLQRHIASNPVNVNILYSYAGVLFHQNRLEEALKETEQLLQLRPSHEGAQKLKKLIEAKTKK
jgi:tetratricopeptide (TPR) repeat protein